MVWLFRSIYDPPPFSIPLRNIYFYWLFSLSVFRNPLAENFPFFVLSPSLSPSLILFRNPLVENFLSVTPFHRLSRSLSSSRIPSSEVSSPLSWSVILLGPLSADAADACRCHYGRVREDGGRRTFKSTPPQSNYRPGHDDAHALFMADAACLVHAHTCTREQRETEKRTAGGWTRWMGPVPQGLEKPLIIRWHYGNV